MNDSATDRALPPTEPRTTADVAEAERLLSVLRTGGDARRVKVRKLRRSVRGDTYENDLKLSVAVDRMADEMR